MGNNSICIRDTRTVLCFIMLNVNNINITIFSTYLKVNEILTFCIVSLISWCVGNCVYNAKVFIRVVYWPGKWVSRGNSASKTTEFIRSSSWVSSCISCIQYNVKLWDITPEIYWAHFKISPPFGLVNLWFWKNIFWRENLFLFYLFVFVSVVIR